MKYVRNFLVFLTLAAIMMGVTMLTCTQQLLARAQPLTLGGPTTTNIVTDKDNGTTQRIVCNGYNMTVYVTMTPGTTSVSSVNVGVYYGGTTVVFGSLVNQPVFSTGVTSVALTCNATGGSSNPAWYNPLPLTVNVTSTNGAAVYCTNTTAFTVEVTGPGDINGDHTVDMTDVMLEVGAFDTYMVSPPQPPQPSFNGPVTINWTTTINSAARAYPDADITDSHYIDLANIVAVLYNFDHTYS
jgi:hypothetical protein